MNTLQRGDHRKDCCKVEENLGPVVRLTPDITFRQCAVCGCRHFEAVADPGKIAMIGAGIGG